MIIKSKQVELKFLLDLVLEPLKVPSDFAHSSMEFICFFITIKQRNGKGVIYTLAPHLIMSKNQSNAKII